MIYLSSTQAMSLVRVTNLPIGWSAISGFSSAVSFSAASGVIISSESYASKQREVEFIINLTIKSHLIGIRKAFQKL